MEEDDEIDDSETDESEAVDDGDWDVDYACACVSLSQQEWSAAQLLL